MYYDKTGETYIAGMKILPLQTSELKTLLQADIKYPQVYRMLDEAYRCEEAPKEWYENHIVRAARDAQKFR